MEVTGFNETVSAIQDHLKEIERNASRAVRLAGQAYANDVKMLSPYKTGTLRRSIHVEKVVVDGEQTYVVVGTDLPYARRQEYGFYGMTDSLGRTYHQLPRPYFRPPLDTEMSKYIAIMKGALPSNFGTYNTTLGRMIGNAMTSEDLFSGNLRTYSFGGTSETSENDFIPVSEMWSTTIKDPSGGWRK